MATKQAVVSALALLATNFAGDVTAEKITTWRAALRDVSDDELKSGIAHVIKTHRGEFIPPVAVILDACIGKETLDIEAVISAIDRAGSYNSLTGWSHPRVDKVRELFGPAIAEAYGAIGGASRLFASNETTREIAARDFGKLLSEERNAPEGRFLPPAQPRTMIGGPGEPV